MSQPKWGEFVAWAKREIEKARGELETQGMSHDDTERLRTRITVLRDLQTITDTQTAPEMPPPVPYT